MKVFFCLLILTAVCSAAHSQALPRSDTPTSGIISIPDSTSALAEHFNELAQIWMRAYNTGDSTTLTALYAPDADYISSHVQGLVAHGRGRLIANFQRGVKTGGHIDSVSILSIQISCDLATLLCKYEATNSGQKAIGRNMLVVKKMNDRWLIILHMTVV